MRYVRFFLALAVTFGFVRLFQTSFKIGENQLPPVGNFFNPFSGFWQNAEPKTGFLPADFKISGLDASTKIVYDERRVPHIFAQNLEDAAAVQGFVHAQFRLFQMDIASRRGAGRLAEVLGEKLLPADLDAKHKGLLKASERMLEMWKKSPDDWKLIEAYTAGVNAFIENLKEKDWPLEYKLIGFAPEKWTTLKTAICAKNMAENLSMLEDDAQLSAVAERLGDAAVKELFQDWNMKQKPIVPDFGQWKGIKADVEKPIYPTKTDETDAKSIGFEDFSEKQESGVGSNNWAVAGKKTRSGHPLLCNDPHLGLSLPSVWFECQIHAAGANAYGVSLPGCPGIVIGFNEHIAWGQTNTGIDVLDWYKIKWADNAHNQYLLDGQPHAVELELDTIFVKGREKPVVEPVKWTIWGPIASENPKNVHCNMAMRWLPNETPDGCVLATFRKLMQSKNYDDYKEALKNFDTPGQNFVFASNDGDVAIRVNGKIPIKQVRQGRTAQDGSLSTTNWRGFIPFENLPFLKNPQRGWVGSANQNSAPMSYPYYLWGLDFEDFRSRRLTDLMENLDSATVDDMKRIQQDVFSVKAADATKAMLKLLNVNELNAAEKSIYEKMSGWNFNYDADAVEPSLFEMWYDSTYRATFDEFFKLREVDSVMVALPKDYRFIELLERDTTSRWFDLAETPEKETARQIVNSSFKKMVAAAGPKLPLGDLVWYKNKGTEIRHLTRIPAFGVQNIHIGGGKHILCAASKYLGPSWRMIVDLSENVEAWAVIPGGVSGNPGSPMYETGIDEWSKGEYFKLHFWKNEGEGGSTATTQTFSGK